MFEVEGGARNPVGRKRQIVRREKKSIKEVRGERKVE